MSDRVLLVDLMLQHRKYRIICVYVPHAGYSLEIFEACFEELQLVIRDAQAQAMKCMVGGDFNAELYRGWRGDRLEELMCEARLDVRNDTDRLMANNAWTFRSALGHRRTIDYCFVSSDLVIESAQAIDHLDFGSDHRAVQCQIILPTGERQARQQRKTHCTDWNAFEKVARDDDRLGSSKDIPELEMQLIDVAKQCSEQPSTSKSKLWDTVELQQLRRQRREARDHAERRRLSKLIWQLTRKQLRILRTSEAAARLKEFKGLSNLEQIHMYPRRNRTMPAPPVDRCAKLLEKVYTAEQATDYNATGHIPSFTLSETQRDLKQMKKGRSCEKLGA